MKNDKNSNDFLEFFLLWIKQFDKQFMHKSAAWYLLEIVFEALKPSQTANSCKVQILNERVHRLSSIYHCFSSLFKGSAKRNNYAISQLLFYGSNCGLCAVCLLVHVTKANKRRRPLDLVIFHANQIPFNFSRFFPFLNFPYTLTQCKCTATDK